KFLRVLESKQFRRLGSNQHHTTDIRVIAATNRDLRAEVNEKGFRSDLYFRLAVVRVRLPALRERPADIGLLVEKFLTENNGDPVLAARLRAPEFLGNLERAPWPGNVRELRNYIEQCVVLERTPEIASARPVMKVSANDLVDFTRPWAEC